MLIWLQLKEPFPPLTPVSGQFSEGLTLSCNRRFAPDGSRLGSVTELSDAQVDHRGGEVGEAQPTSARFVAPESDAGPIFEAGKQVLNLVAPGIQRRVPCGRVGHAPLGRGMDGATLCSQGGAERGRDITPVKSCIAGRDARGERGRITQIRVLSGARDQPKNPARTIGTGMKFGA